MRIAPKMLITMLVGLLGWGSAQASVIYDWQPVAGTEHFTTQGGHLMITDAAYRAGGLSYDYYRNIAPPDFPQEPGQAYYPDSPVLSASLQLFSSETIGPNFNIMDQPREVPDSQDLPSQGFFSLGFTGSKLNGSLYLNNGESEFGMTSNESDDLWTVNSFNSDRANGACFRGGCGGATGRWVLASTTPNDVPSPAVWSLFLLSALTIMGVGGARQYRNNRSMNVPTV